MRMELLLYRCNYNTTDYISIALTSWEFNTSTLSKVSSIICTETFMLPHKMNFNSTTPTIRGTYMYHNLEVHDEILYHTMVGGVSWIDNTNWHTSKGVLLGQKIAMSKGEAFHNFSWTLLVLTKSFSEEWLIPVCGKLCGESPSNVCRPKLRWLLRVTM